MPEYRPARGFPDYRVGDDGSVWSKLSSKLGEAGEWHKLTPAPFGKTGHLKVTLKRDGERFQCPVHRLVLEAFVGPCPLGMEACHDPDPTPSNCTLPNLRWGTRSDNTQDMIRHGRHFTPFRNRTPAAGPKMVKRVRALSEAGNSTRLIARVLRLTKSTVHQIVAKKGVYANA